jgi:hypothetical protein
MNVKSKIDSFCAAIAKGSPKLYPSDQAAYTLPVKNRIPNKVSEP